MTEKQKLISIDQVHPSGESHGYDLLFLDGTIVRNAGICTVAEIHETEDSLFYLVFFEKVKKK